MMIALGIITGIVFFILSGVISIKMNKSVAQFIILFMFALFIFMLGFISVIALEAYMITVFVLVMLLLLFVIFIA